MRSAIGSAVFGEPADGTLTILFIGISLSEQEILAAVQTLSPAYRAVFNLYVIEGFSHKEIGEALQVTESTSRSNLVKARTKLQEYFLEKRMNF